MKLTPTLTATVLLAFASFASFAEEAAKPTPLELVAAQDKHDAEIIAATKKINEKYLDELAKMKKKAMTDGKLELAVAIDKEIKEVEAEIPLTKREIEKKLIGTKWQWNSRAGETVVFLSNGKAKQSQYGLLSWEVINPKERIIEGRTAWNNGKYKMKFNAEFTTVEHSEGSWSETTNIIPQEKPSQGK